MHVDKHDMAAVTYTILKAGAGCQLCRARSRALYNTSDRTVFGNEIGKVRAKKGWNLDVIVVMLDEERRYHVLSPRNQFSEVVSQSHLKEGLRERHP